MNQNFELKQFGDIKYFRCIPLEETNLVKHVFTTRQGGVSEIPFDSLNLSFNVGDKVEMVLENRKRISKVLNLNYQDIISSQQIHKDNILIINKKNRNKLAIQDNKIIADADALVTDIPGIPLLMCYADCVPIMVLDPVKKAIALIHSGRRGTELEITFKTIKKMQDIFITNPQSCLAAIFPSIAPCCYRFSKHSEISNFWITEENLKQQIILIKDNEVCLDLQKANYLQLLKAGLQKDKIFIHKMCTYDFSSFFFSHRRDKGKTGRMGALLMIK